MQPAGPLGSAGFLYAKCGKMFMLLYEPENVHAAVREGEKS